MFVVLFEVQPHQHLWQEYLDTAKLLRPELERIDGFIDNERFASARTEGRLLSLSTWRDEKSLIRWRTHAIHHDQGQERGRFEIFQDYRLRVAEVTTDSQPPPDLTVREDRFDETEIGTAKAATVLEPTGADEAHLQQLSDILSNADGIVDVERYDGILEPHKPLILASWAERNAAKTGTPIPTEGRVRHVRVVREYGMRERREAPQYFPDV